MLCYCRWFHTQLGSVNLYDASKSQSQNLSWGMLCRLSVAMACISNPDILILNEPATGLSLASWRQVDVAIFIGSLENNVAFGVLVDVIRYSLSLSFFLFFLCVLVDVGGDRVSEARL